MKQAKNHEMINVKTDLGNFLHFYLSQSMSLQDLDDWANRLQKKWGLTNYPFVEFFQAEEDEDNG